MHRTASCLLGKQGPAPSPCTARLAVCLGNKVARASRIRVFHLLHLTTSRYLASYHVRGEYSHVAQKLPNCSCLNVVIVILTHADDFDFFFASNSTSFDMCWDRNVNGMIPAPPRYRDSTVSHNIFSVVYPPDFAGLMHPMRSFRATSGNSYLQQPRCCLDHAVNARRGSGVPVQRC